MKYYIALLFIYYVIIGTVGVSLTIYDKRASGRGARRISEKTLLLFGLVGAAAPMYITMKKIRHKTRHKKFMLGLPAEIFLHIVIAAAVLYCFSGAASVAVSGSCSSISETVFLMSTLS